MFFDRSGVFAEELVPVWGLRGLALVPAVSGPPAHGHNRRLEHRDVAVLLRIVIIALHKRLSPVIWNVIWQLPGQLESVDDLLRAVHFPL